MKEKSSFAKSMSPSLLLTQMSSMPLNLQVLLIAWSNHNGRPHMDFQRIAYESMSYTLDVIVDFSRRFLLEDSSAGNFVMEKYVQPQIPSIPGRLLSP